MKTYRIIFENNQGSHAIDGIAATVNGEWHNTVSNYDLQHHDIGFIDIADEDSDYLEELLKNDENVIEFDDVTQPVFLTCAQAAEIIGVKPATVKRWCQDGKIDGAIKPGHDWLIPRKSIDGLERSPSRWDKNHA